MKGFRQRYKYWKKVCEYDVFWPLNAFLVTIGEFIIFYSGALVGFIIGTVKKWRRLD